MRKFFPALATGFVLLTSFASDKPIEDTEKASVAEATSCSITVISIRRYTCGDVYEGSTTYHDPGGNCGSQTFYEVTTGIDDGVCTHDHSAPPDELQ